MKTYYDFMLSASEYWLGTYQRNILFLDTLRKRGDIYIEHLDKGKPPVLDFEYEIIMDGRSLEKQVNYDLVRIIPEFELKYHEERRPFVIIDPRAGHGPGIGGFKKDSEVGVAMANGHAVYFIIFHPAPIQGQTI